MRNIAKKTIFQHELIKGLIIHTEITFVITYFCVLLPFLCLKLWKIVRKCEKLIFYSKSGGKTCFCKLGKSLTSENKVLLTKRSYNLVLHQLLGEQKVYIQLNDIQLTLLLGATTSSAKSLSVWTRVAIKNANKKKLLQKFKFVSRGALNTWIRWPTVKLPSDTLWYWRETMISKGTHLTHITKEM